MYVFNKKQTQNGINYGFTDILYFLYFSFSFSKTASHESNAANTETHSGNNSSVIYSSNSRLKIMRTRYTSLSFSNTQCPVVVSSMSFDYISLCILSLSLSLSRFLSNTK
eukprot:sb/3477252/